MNDRNVLFDIYMDSIRKGAAPPELVMRQLYPDAWKCIDERREREANAKRDAMYVDPYSGAVGQFLEYECGRPLNNPLTGCTV